MARRQRAPSFLSGLLKLVALVAVAGAAGAAIGAGLPQLSGDDAQRSAPASITTTGPAPPPSAQLELRVLAAILRPAGTPSGRRRQRARLVVRLRAQNRGRTSVGLNDPILRVGSVRVGLDPATGRSGSLATIAAGEARSFTLRYELSGDATPKATRDRRARLDVGAQSVAVRLTVGAAVQPSP